MVSKFRHSILVATLLWLITAGFGLFLWYGVASDCCSDLKFFHGVSVLRGEVKLGRLGQIEADRRISIMQQEYLRIVLDKAAMPLIGSLVLIPILTLLIGWWSGDMQIPNINRHL